ncbi:MAG: hypothetical protein U0835_16745 [Isosphaeraceae bacterium]
MMGTLSLSGPGRAVIDAMAGGPGSWRTPAELASQVGRSVDETSDILCDLDLAGWVQVLEREAGLFVALSPLGAERLGLRLVEVGASGLHRWVGLGDPEPPSPRSKNLCAGERAATLGFVVDPCPSPPESAERAERAERAVAFAARLENAAGPARPSGATAGQGDPPAPSVLVGVGLTPWPGPNESPEPGGVCPACGSRKLRAHMYCLCCDRWGLDGPPPTDGGLARTPEFRRSRPAPDPAAEKAELDRLRDRRKARRMRRRQAQAQAQNPPRRTAGPLSGTSPA